MVRVSSSAFIEDRKEELKAKAQTVRIPVYTSVEGASMRIIFVMEVALLFL